MLLCKLQKGIVIIDSPGVGESDEMDEIVIKYLPEAFAFIYVANSTNAGGVKKDRVSTWIIESPFREFTHGVKLGLSRLLESCFLECQNVAKKLPKIQKLMLPNHLKFLPKFLYIFL